MEASPYTLEIPVPMTQPGYWLYVWKAEITPNVEWLYVGRTGNDSSKTAKPPFVRAAEHFDPNAADSFLKKIRMRHYMERLRKSPLRLDGEPDYTGLSLVTHGPLFQNFYESTDLRDQGNAIVGPLETALREALRYNNYVVLGENSSRGNLCARCWQDVRQAFKKHFTLTKQCPRHIQRPEHLCSLHA